MKIPPELFPQVSRLCSKSSAIVLTCLVFVFSLPTAGCRASLEQMAKKEIERRPVSKVYLSGLKYFGDLMSRGQVPGLKSEEDVVQQPSDDLMSEEEMMEVKYPFKMTVKLKNKANANVLYSYTLLKETPTSNWRIVEA
jgi:hypothetical protein